MKRIRVVLLDEHQSVRDGLILLLNRQADMRVVGHGGTAAEALHMVRDARPHVVVAEMRFPDGTGPELTRRLKKARPAVNVLAFTAQEDPESLEAMLVAKASGYVLKRSPSAELFRAIRTAHDGQVFCDPIMAGRTLARQATGLEAPGQAGSIQLSEQQTHVLRLLAWGYANKEIAERLQISVKTVETYRTRLQRKLELKSRPELVLFALRKGWLKAP
jgi:DNA-binding NarL/FixJ family response regulator